MSQANFPEWLIVILSFLGAGLVLSLALFGVVVWRVRKIRLPENADWITTMRLTPLVVVLLLDLLDFSLDIFSVGITWPLLGYLGLKPLRNITVLEGIIPGTQLIPTLTLTWLLARVLPDEPIRHSESSMETYYLENHQD
ncbi:MAG: hypothetical protein PVH60_11725 [Anaerolineales bacterium]|jgi:hypothetical protein